MVNRVPKLNIHLKWIGNDYIIINNDIIVWSGNRDFISIHYGTSNGLEKVLYAYNNFRIYIRL